MTKYVEEIKKAMSLLAKDPDTIFLGQEAETFYHTMEHIPREKILEMPVMEDAQLGISIGLSLKGYTPISMYTRMDFFILAMNQLVNHLDKIKSLSGGEFNPKVIIRVCIGYDYPLLAGLQHTGDYTEALKQIVKEIKVVKLDRPEDIVPAYEMALNSDKSTILIEDRRKYYWE